jgi:4-hydroxy-tetrahydrodipicolinate synthase
MLTPFDERGSIDENELRRMVDFQIEAGVDGVFPCGSVGEAVHLRYEEKVTLIKVVADKAGGRVSVTPGVGSSFAGEAVRLARRAAALGCDAVVAAPPYFYKLPPASIEAHFRTLAEAVAIPVVLYNIPLFSQPLSHDLVGRLSRLERVVGLKDSSGSMVDFLHFMDCSTRAGGRLALLTGREETLLPTLFMGGRGCMTATAGILPEVMVAIFKAWQAGDHATARTLQLAVLPVVREMFSLPFPAGFKTAMEIRGFSMGPLKQPLGEADGARRHGVRKRLEAMIAALLDRLQ